MTLAVLFLAGIYVGFYVGFVGRALWFAYVVRQARALGMRPLDPQLELMERLNRVDAVLAFAVGPEPVLGFKRCVEGRQ